jgi:hypothetical protein
MHRLRPIAPAVAAATLLCAAAVSAEEIAAETEPATLASEAEATVEIDDAPTAEQMALDLVLMRPLSLVGTVIGLGVFVVSTPFCALAWNCVDPARRLVLEPAKYTFTRDLGDLD